MKILKYGDGYPKTITCEDCNSELEYEVEDIFRHTDNYITKTETYEYIKCPVCGKTITVNVCVVDYSQPEPQQPWWKTWF